MYKSPQLQTMYAIYKYLAWARRMAFPQGAGYMFGVSIFLDIRFVFDV